MLRHMTRTTLLPIKARCSQMTMVNRVQHVFAVPNAVHDLLTMQHSLTSRARVRKARTGYTNGPGL